MPLRQSLSFPSMGCSCPDVFNLDILSPHLCRRFHTHNKQPGKPYLFIYLFILEAEDKKQMAEMKNTVKHVTFQNLLYFSSRESWTFIRAWCLLYTLLLVTGWFLLDSGWSFPLCMIRLRCSEARIFPGWFFD